ncbi:MAG: AMP-binding protein, partial [Acidimicrobiales bacterium]
MDAQQVSEFQFVGQDIPSLLARWAEAKPEHPFLVWEPRTGAGRSWTYRAFHEDVRRVAAGLHQRGVAKGDRVLIHSENCPEMVLAWYACAQLGAVGVTTNTRSVGAEIAYFAGHTGCVGAITQPQYAALVSESAPGLDWIVVTEDNSGDPAPADQAHGFGTFASLLADPDGLPTRRPEPMLPAGIMFTSGTTSRPKAVVHTHANALWAGRVGPQTIDMTGDDTYLVFLPFFHVNAQSWSF